MALQAQSRAHRIGQTRPVVVYQLITKCYVELRILQKSKEKLTMENLVMNMNPSNKPTVDELHLVLLHGARTILDRKKIIATTVHCDDEAIETLLKLDPVPGEFFSADDNGYLGSIQCFTPETDEAKDPPHSPKAEEWKEILRPVSTETEVCDLGKEKRQKKEVKYYSDNESNGDEEYSPSPEASSNNESSDRIRINIGER